MVIHVKYPPMTSVQKVCLVAGLGSQSISWALPLSKLTLHTSENPPKSTAPLMITNIMLAYMITVYKRERKVWGKTVVRMNGISLFEQWLQYGEFVDYIPYCQTHKFPSAIFHATFFILYIEIHVSVIGLKPPQI